MFSFYWVTQIYALLPFLRRHKIPWRSCDRNEKHPIVIAGGIGVNNPVPLAHFVDIFVLGDGEEAVPELLTLAASLNRNEFLFAVHEAGYYVPALHRGETILARWSKDIGTSLKYPIYSLSGRSRQLEIARGCANHCRFCTIAWTKRPYRETPAKNIIEAMQNEEVKGINLFAPNGAGHSKYREIYRALQGNDKRLTSCDARVDDVQEIDYAPGTIFNLGVDGCSQRLRDAVGKRVNSDQIVTTIKTLTGRGCRSIKLYLIVDLPGETCGDQDEFYDLLEQIGRETQTGDFCLQIVNTSFNPLPHTPLQWAPVARGRKIRDHWRDLFRNRGKFKLPYKLARTARASDVSYLLATMLLRGGPEMAGVLEQIVGNQKRYLYSKKHFYGGTEMIMELLADNNVPDVYTGRNPEQPLPWDFINFGVSREKLLSEYRKFKEVLYL